MKFFNMEFQFDFRLKKVDNSAMEIDFSGRRVDTGNLSKIPPECVPFAMLTPVQRIVLQLASDGYTVQETADKLKIAPRTVGTHRRDITNIGDQQRPESAGSEVILALVIDGITNGYLSHTIPEGMVYPQLTPLQSEIADMICQGLTQQVIAKKTSKGASTIEAYIDKLYKKFEVKNFYHFISRYTYLKLLPGSAEESKDKEVQTHFHS